ncbi:MAG TPA: MFS transporter [Bryobacteraceae bacterium]|jgi:MFS family permease|nr:MFS transporter [Bryobacteraceae bacterium]
MLDAMDVMLYAFALTAIRDEFHLSSAAAGAMASATLLASACGGVLFGVLADRMGRAPALGYAILIYSAFTGLTATAASVAALLVWRTLVGIGMGGVWSAGSVLVAESWPAEHRGKAAGFMQSGWAVGYILAALLAAAVMPHWGWRPLFVAGVAPALLAVWLCGARPWGVARGTASPPLPAPVHPFALSPAMWRTAAIASSVTSCVLFAYWGLFTWMPSYLSSPVARGGAGMSVVQSTGWIVPMQIGAFFGYTLFGFLADRFGRRPVFLTFVLSAAVLVPIYGQWGRRQTALMLMGPLIGFFGHGYFSVFGALLAELFPTAVRATAQGLCYNVGRAAGALAPFTIGALADHFGIGSALALTSVFFAAGGALIFLLPETRGEELT